MNNFLTNKKILLIIGGGISAYKSLDLIRFLKKSGAEIKTVLTSGGKNFITPLSIASLSQNKVYEDLFDSQNEAEMNHIALSRWCDLILVVPATANLIAKFANGQSDDLASTLVLASDKQIILVPAMNVRMWIHDATQLNMKKLLNYGYLSLGPDSGEMACGEYGEGKMLSPNKIHEYLQSYFSDKKLVSNKKLKALVTAGPTVEYIDPVRYITNESSGKQGYEIAKSLARYGVNTTLISGPTSLMDPKNVNVIRIKTAEEMLNKTKEILPVNIAVCAAAVCDFKIKNYNKKKIKKENLPKLNIDLKQNQDILEFLSKHNALRPELVIGFSAETHNIINFAREKKLNKYCDWIVANDVSNPEIGFNSDLNEVSIIYKNNKIEKINKNSKSVIADKISKKIINNFN